MPPEPNKNEQPKRESEPKQKPRIRTLESDLKEFFKDEKPSLSTIVGQEVRKKNNAPAAPSMFPQKKGLLPLLVGGVALLLLVGGGFYFYQAFRAPSAQIPERIIPPEPFFATESARTIEVNLLDRSSFHGLMIDSLDELERPGSIKRILIKVEDGSRQRFATLDDLIRLLRISLPETLVDITRAPLMSFIHYARVEPHFGFAVPTRNQNRTFAELIAWEESILRDLNPMFFNRRTEFISGVFEDRTYRNIDWRYLKLDSQKDFGIAYTVFPGENLLVITTAKESMETIIDRLFFIL